MKRNLLLPVFILGCTSLAYGRGLLIPVEPDLPPLAMLNHHVNVTLEDQVAVTRVEQTFRNHTDRKLEATYVFPVPEGASVRDFAMWVDGKRVKGELLTAERAKKMYTDIVRQTKNPAMLDYIGSDLLSLKVFPVPPQGDQKVEVSFTAVAKKEHDIVEYVYPLETDRASASTLEEFQLSVKVRSQQPIGSIYSPTHEITVAQVNDHEAVVTYQRKGATLDRDFQLFYTSSGQDIGLTALQHRPISTEDGYAMLLVSPRAELSRDQKVPRDVVFVVDTSGSMMQDKKIEQAKKALQHCLSGLTPDDRFGLINFATTVNHYRNELVSATDEQLAQAKGWVADLYAGGGTAIHEALMSALELRSGDKTRMFTVVFFTDGQPTIGERDTDKILSALEEKNTGNTRIFSFGVGDDLNAVLLDQIAEQTRAVNRFVRPGENLEVKVSSFFAKINHPVLANLKITTPSGVRLAEVYPPQLPDLFHGDQLVVLARYQGAGHSAIMLKGNVGVHEKEFVYELDFADQTDDKPFVEELWARRKVGYLLDQIRVNGEQTELVDEVVRLAKNYGITTPYTSYLIMPDAPIQLAAAEADSYGRAANKSAPAALARRGADFGGGGRDKLEDFAKRIQRQKGDLAKNRGNFQDEAFAQAEKALAARASSGGPSGQAPVADARERLRKAQEMKSTLDRAHYNYANGRWRQNQVRTLGVNLAVSTNHLKCQSQLQASAVRRVCSRNCMEYGGVWIDEDFTAKTPTVAVKAQSDAYFRILERQPQMKEVFKLGNHVVWIAPNGTGLVIDAADGKEQLSNHEIDSLFVMR